jgi:hypothetical protein
MTPQKKNKLGKITRLAPRADSKKRQWETSYATLVFFGREPSKVFTEDKKL